MYDPNFPGGIGRKTPWQPAISTDLQREKIQCAVNLCHKKSSNGICDEECNTLGKSLVWSAGWMSLDWIGLAGWMLMDVCFRL